MAPSHLVQRKASPLGQYRGRNLKLICSGPAESRPSRKKLAECEPSVCRCIAARHRQQADLNRNSRASDRNVSRETIAHGLECST